jgi:hypothetical protein
MQKSGKQEPEQKKVEFNSTFPDTPVSGISISLPDKPL